MDAPLRIHDLPTAERPRERLLERGAKALTTAELLAILLRTGLKGASAVDVAQQLLREFGSLETLSRVPVGELQRIRGIGGDKAVTLKAAFELAVRLTEEVRRESPPLDNPEAIARLIRDEMQAYETERLVVLLLNTRRKLIRIEEIAKGVLDAVLIHPREVFRHAIIGNAHSLVLAHNHPGGDPSPSEADVRMTRDIIRAGQLLKIDVLDHIIIGRKSALRPQDYVSLRELGHFYA
jgi:DNA repair protein RadC